MPAEIYHLKAAGKTNWPKLDAVIARVEAARRQGLEITADMYTYTAGATGFDACMPALGARRRLRGAVGRGCRIPRRASASSREMRTPDAWLREPVPLRRLA